MLEQTHPSVAPAAALSPRAMICMIVPIAALSVTALGAAWPVGMRWDSLLAVVAVASAALALAGLIGAAISLLVMDALAEIRSRAAWAAVAAGRSSAALVTECEQADHVYPPAVHDEAVQAVLRAHRCAVPRLAVEPVDETEPRHDQNQAGPVELSCAPQGPAAGPVGHPIRCRPGGAEISGGGAGHHGNGRRADAEGARKAWTVVQSSAPVLRATRSQPELHFGVRVVKQLRRTVNARTGEAWQGFGSSLRVAGIPIKIVSDIIVLGHDQNGSNGGKPSPGAQFNGAPPIRAGPSTSIAGSTVRSRTQHHPNQSGGFDPTALVEARRQVIALAEALARQAAREDDAAEQREGRSRSAPDMPAEQSSSRDAKDDTS